MLAWAGYLVVAYLLSGRSCSRTLGARWRNWWCLVFSSC